MIGFHIGDQVRVVGLPCSEWRGMSGVIVNVMERPVDQDQQDTVQECAVQLLSTRRWFLAIHLVRATPDRTLRFFRSEILSRWGDLEPDDVVTLNGKRENLVVFLQERYGFGFKRATIEADDIIADVEKRVHIAH